MSKRSKVLIVDDDKSFVDEVRKFLAYRDFSILTASTIKEAEELLTNQVAAVLLDQSLPDGSGAEWVLRAKELCPHGSVVMITEESQVSLVVQAMLNGADNFLVKPVQLHDLLIFLKKSIELGSIRKKSAHSARMNKKAPFLSGDSPATDRMMKLAEIAAGSDSPVLLLGDSGSGKGMLAQWIHDHSSRSSEAFIQINCSGLSSELMQSELFGHEKGAFTSAHADKIGLLELADGGTLFLDECGEMPLETQPKFLKVLEDQHFRRVGGTRDIWSDFRLICATNRELEDMVLEKTFREDLYFRINVFPVRIPPLRERKEEIEDFVDFFLSSQTSRVDGISPQALEMLTNYTWPGNIRELRNVLERACMLSQGGRITPKHIAGLQVKSSASQASRKHSANLRDLEHQHILEVLQSVGGDKKKAAEKLGISRSTLYRKLDESG